MKKTFTLVAFFFSLVFFGTSDFAIADTNPHISSNVVSLIPVGSSFFIPENTLSPELFTGIIDQPFNDRIMYPYNAYIANADGVAIGLSASSYFIEKPYGTDIFSSPVEVSTSFFTSETGAYMLSQGHLPGDYILIFTNNQSVGILTSYFTLDSNGSISFSTPAVNDPYLWSDWCGSDAGKLIDITPVNLCEVGTSGTVSFDGSKWNWDCIDGVVSQSCRAYLATTEPVDGTCGAWDGETFNAWPPLEGLCELRTSLVIPSMVETINGYTWTCSGINGGTSDYCYGNKTSPPLMPELPAGSLEDCSGLSILEGLVCNMGNTLKTIFLPSSEKINELNQTINKMSSKFPFSYISKATETFNDVKGNITETSVLELSIMNSEKSSIDFSTIAFFDYIKMLTTILIVLVFSFWLIRFIKHIF